MLLLPMAILTMADEDDRVYMTRLYREYRALMLTTAWEYSEDSGTVDDIVSESCVALIRHLGKLKEMEKAALRVFDEIYAQLIDNRKQTAEEIIKEMGVRIYRNRRTLAN